MWIPNTQLVESIPSFVSSTECVTLSFGEMKPLLRLLKEVVVSGAASEADADWAHGGGQHFRGDQSDRGLPHHLFHRHLHARQTGRHHSTQTHRH